MSTCYSLICEHHKERTEAVCRTTVITNIGDSEVTLLPFIVEHADCAVRIVSEHESEWCDESYTEWTKDNVDAMMKLNRDHD